MPSVKTPSIFATLLYSGQGKGNVVVTNLGPNVVSVRTGNNASGNIYTSLGVGKTLTGVPAYLCHVKDANGNDISITPPNAITTSGVSITGLYCTIGYTIYY